MRIVDAQIHLWGSGLPSNVFCEKSDGTKVIVANASALEGC
jgi:hypothetical protein